MSIENILAKKKKRKMQLPLRGNRGGYYYDPTEYVDLVEMSSIPEGGNDFSGGDFGGGDFGGDGGSMASVKTADIDKAWRYSSYEDAVYNALVSAGPLTPEYQAPVWDKEGTKVLWTNANPANNVEVSVVHLESFGSKRFNKPGTVSVYIRLGDVNRHFDFKDSEDPKVLAQTIIGMVQERIAVKPEVLSRILRKANEVNKSVKWVDTTYTAFSEGDETHTTDPEIVDEGVEITVLDEFDREDGLSEVDLAALFIRSKGCNQPSSVPFSPGTWYSTEDYMDTDGVYNNSVCKPLGFSSEEQEELYRKVMNYK